ncbi:MAG: hypothetical protein E4H14_03740 [Candidatus Thorarchaeota archaeon]|nr:MAG: hypothetical protein E4H14_03740 [Candidatus Thorarchaeota archaeon]
MDLFRGILGYRPGFEKGADHFNYIHEEFNIDFEDMLFVGDSLKDYERSRGFCNFLGLVGMFDEEAFRNSGHVGHLITNREEILNIVQSKS